MGEPPARERRIRCREALLGCTAVGHVCAQDGMHERVAQHILAQEGVLAHAQEGHVERECLVALCIRVMCCLCVEWERGRRAQSVVWCPAWVCAELRVCGRRRECACAVHVGVQIQVCHQDKGALDELTAAEETLEGDVALHNQRECWVCKEGCGVVCGRIC